MKVAGTTIDSIADVKKVMIYLNLTQKQVEKVEAVGIKLTEESVEELEEKNTAIAEDQGDDRAFRLKRISDTGIKIADGGNTFGQKNNVSPRMVIKDLEAQGLILTDVRAEWKQAKEKGRLALEFQRNPKNVFEATVSQKSFYENLLGMEHRYMWPYLNAPSSQDSICNMTFNFLARKGPDNSGTKKLRIGQGKGKFFACVA